MFKDISPARVTWLLSFLITLLFVLNINVFRIWPDEASTANWFVASTILFFVIVYLFIRYFISNYVFKKVGLIYKIIKKAKSDPKEKRSSQLFKDVRFTNVEEEAEKWARNTAAELNSLKELEAYRKNYVGNISHELKTPIFSIQGYIHTLLEGGLYDKKINKSFLEKAAKNVERMITIVNDLEVITRMESGEVSLDIQSFEIRELILEVFSDLELQANTKHIKMGFKEGSKQSANILADRENIRQVLLNLCTNAIKYGKEGGYVRVGFFDIDHSDLLIEISDNGIGIAEKHLKHLFDRFYRVDKSRSRQIGGTGLGLAIVKHIIEGHGQNIHIRSTLDVGTTIGFTMRKARS
jgi:two-component system phosphate regulon sensor histidine kinase PhoR